MRQDRISDEDISVSIDGKLLEHWIVCCCDWVKLLSFVLFELNWGTSGNFIISIVVLIQETAPENILRWRDSSRCGQMFSNLGKINLLNLIPIWLHGNRCLAINSRSVAPVSTSSLKTTSTSSTSTLLILKLTRSLGLLLPTSIDLSKSLGVLTTTRSWRYETTSAAVGGSLASIHQLKRRFLGSVNFVLKFFVVVASSTIWPSLVGVAPGEISASPQTIGTPERGVREQSELRFWSIGVGFIFFTRRSP